MLAAIAGGVLEGSPSTAVTSPLPMRSVWLYATSATIPRTAPKTGILGQRHHRRACLDMVAFTSGLPSVHHLDPSRAPLGLITTSVQALAGVLLPSASVFLLLLCNDPEVLGPWVNKRWLNVVASVIIGVLLTLSGTLVVSTVFPHLNVADVAMVVALALVVAGGGAGLLLQLTQRRGPRPGPVSPRLSEQGRRNWRMPPLALLKPVQWSPATKLAMLLLRGYLVVSVVLLVVKAVQLGGG
jgi:hypothetical protein